MNVIFQIGDVSNSTQVNGAFMKTKHIEPIFGNETKYIYLVNRENHEVNTRIKFINEEWFHLSKHQYVRFKPKS